MQFSQSCKLLDPERPVIPALLNKTSKLSLFALKKLSSSFHDFSQDTSNSKNLPFISFAKADPFSLFISNIKT